MRGKGKIARQRLRLPPRLPSGPDERDRRRISILERCLRLRRISRSAGRCRHAHPSWRIDAGGDADRRGEIADLPAARRDAAGYLRGDQPTDRADARPASQRARQRHPRGHADQRRCRLARNAGCLPGRRAGSSVCRAGAGEPAGLSRIPEFCAAVPVRDRRGPLRYPNGATISAPITGCCAA